MSTTPPPDTLAAALALHAAGCSVISVHADGSKRPRGTWRHYQQARADEATLHRWFAEGHPGIGVITGSVSGGLEMLELEGRAVDEGVLDTLAEIAQASGLAELWTRIATGWLERSPSGGLHFHYRVTGGPVPGNTKLASRPAREDELTPGERELLATHPGKVITRGLIETRGEGGFVVTAPSSGPVHASGLPYEIVAGGPDTCPTVTADEHRALHLLCRMVDSVPTSEPPAPPAQPPAMDEATAFLFSSDAPAGAATGLTPGDDFEARTTWAEILTPHGWTALRTIGGTTYWRRPGKDTPGISATTGRAADRDRLYVFTTSTEFDAERPYTKFGAYALLTHGGDHSGAARELRRRGYGERPQHLRAVPPPSPPAASSGPRSDGATALAPEAQESGWAAPQEPRPLLPMPMPARDWDDIGNAQRVVDRYGTEIVWVTDTEQWATYDAGRWSFKGANTAVWTRVVSTIDNLRDEADNYDDKPPVFEADCKPTKEEQLSERERFEKFARTQRMRTRLAAAREILQAHPALHVHMDHFDRPELLLNVANGVVDLTTGELHPHDRTLYLMQQSPVRYEPDAKAPRWEDFLASAMPDEERRTYLARVVGYTLTASTQEQAMFIHHGDGANGKGVFMRVLMALLGDYAQSVPRSTLLAKQSDGIPNDVARMVGKRLLATTETSAGKRLDDELVKQLTGEDPMSARFMRAEFFDFRPVGKIHLATNYLPNVGGGHGIARRLQDIGWDVTVPPNRRVPKLDEKIMASEAAGVLNWAIAGCIEWQQRGLDVPAAVQEKTREHLANSDPMVMWMDEQTVPEGAEYSTETGLLYANYKLWSEASGMRPMSIKAFVLALKERGIDSHKHPKTRRSITFGLRLTTFDGRP
ncbi:phage/plasmid primase, P4 family [Streptomyces sp. 796.1]|uniref:phage/plasmid primase, P4 family n=1 Tax=Streptomyces sp. 796.1 TaxID=3163029 RepID=UPI0039C97C3B